MELMSKVVEVAKQSSGSQTLLGCILLASGCCFYHYYNKYNHWSRLGIKGDQPWPLVGEILVYVFGDRLKRQIEAPKKYGKVYGLYMNGTPIIVVADPEVIRQIAIKDFDAFPNHNVSEFANKYQQTFLVWLQGEHWKKVRTLMSPTFTRGKIKRMFRFMDVCADDMIEQLNEIEPDVEKRKANGFLVNLKSSFEMYTLDGIATCCYGLKLQREQQLKKQTNIGSAVVATRDDFVKHASKVTNMGLYRMFALLLVPKFILKSIGFEQSASEGFAPLIKRIEFLVERRKQSSKQSKYDDLLQLLIDARLEDDLDLDELDQAENHHAGLTQESIVQDHAKMVEELADHERKRQEVAPTATQQERVKLELFEILSEAAFFLAAGLETTSILLSNCVYSLAFHPEIQQRLYEQLSSIVELDADKKRHLFKYETLTTCVYLDAVISETLRLLSPAPYTDRKSECDYKIEKYNINIPKGTRVLFSIYGVQNDPEYWEEPERFDPDRFMPGKKELIVPGSYIPFSLGPRHCIGMRFSLTEAKLGLARLMMEFRFEPAPNTSFPPAAALAPGLIRIKNPLIRMIPRRK